jgi:glycosyltransferase involved in cell wall biosynthesis
VEVILSTFNAGRYLTPLLDSVIKQADVSIYLRIRDDGSTDDTRALLANYARDHRVELHLGSHVGPWRSYMSLLQSSSAEHDFLAFCDQDDVWLPSKLSVAVTRLGPSSRRPTLYCSRMTITDANLRPIATSAFPRRALTISNALVENVLCGPTIVLNNKGQQLLASDLPTYMVMHDAWAYLVFAGLGDILFDPQPRLLYRLHGANWSSLHLDPVSRCVRFVTATARSYLSERVAQASEFSRLFHAQLDPDDRTIVSRFCESQQTWRSAVAYAAKPDVYRQTAVDNLILRFLLALRLSGRDPLDGLHSGTARSPIGNSHVTPPNYI